MAQNTLTQIEVIDKIAAAIGKDKAQTLFAEAAQQTGLSGKNELERDEILQICSVLKEKGGIITIISNLLAAEVYLMDI